MRIPRAGIRPLALALLAIVVLAACSGESKDAASVPTATPAAQTATATASPSPSPSPTPSPSPAPSPTPDPRVQAYRAGVTTLVQQFGAGFSELAGVLRAVDPNNPAWWAMYAEASTSIKETFDGFQALQPPPCMAAVHQEFLAARNEIVRWHDINIAQLRALRERRFDEAEQRAKEADAILSALNPKLRTTINQFTSTNCT